MNRFLKIGPFIIAGIFFGGLIWTVVDLFRYSNDLVKDITLKSAGAYSKAISEFRELYTSHVVKTAQKAGLEVSHDFEGRERVIPLPATLTKMLSKELEANDEEGDTNQQGASTFLYSKYPFPWREDSEGLNDSFRQRAWKALVERKEDSYFEFVEKNGAPFLRYATPDRMRASCINCHNSHPESPKFDWEIGDIRGILEVQHFVHPPKTMANSKIKAILANLIIVALIGIGGVVSVLFLLMRIQSLTSFFHMNPTPVIKTDLSGRVLVINPAAEEIFQCEIGSDISEISKDLALERFSPKLFKNDGIQTEFSYKNMNFFVDVRKNPNIDVIKYYFVDISDKKDLEKKLKEEQAISMQSSRLASIGEMAGGIAHEVNTPLGAIMLSVENIENELDGTDFDKSYVKKTTSNIKKTVERISRIIRALRSYSRGTSNDPFLDTPVEELVKNTISLVAEKIKMKGIELRMNLEGIENIVIQCRESQIGQVLMNLINNAQDAIEELDEKWIEVKITDLENEVRLDVVDSGSGIPSEIIDKIFDPFFTSKEVGKGTGIGLSISAGIIKDHNGQLFVDDGSKNTCFAIILPKIQVAFDEDPFDEELEKENEDSEPKLFAS